MIALHFSNAYLLLELPGKLDIAQIHEIFLGDMRIEIFLVVGKGIKRVIIELAFVLVVVHDSYIFIFNQDLQRIYLPYL
jgi:hypothetical protein